MRLEDFVIKQKQLLDSFTVSRVPSKLPVLLDEAVEFYTDCLRSLVESYGTMHTDRMQMVELLYSLPVPFQDTSWNVEVMQLVTDLLARGTVNFEEQVTVLHYYYVGALLMRNCGELIELIVDNSTYSNYEIRLQHVLNSRGLDFSPTVLMQVLPKYAEYITIKKLTCMVMLTLTGEI